MYLLSILFRYCWGSAAEYFKYLTLPATLQQCAKDYIHLPNVLPLPQWQSSTTVNKAEKKIYFFTSIFLNLQRHYFSYRKRSVDIWFFNQQSTRGCNNKYKPNSTMSKCIYYYKEKNAFLHLNSQASSSDNFTKLLDCL